MRWPASGTSTNASESRNTSSTTPIGGPSKVWVRLGDQFVLVEHPQGWVSPRLGVRLELDGVDLVLTRPDGRPFRSYLDLFEDHEREHARAEQADARAEQADARAEQADARAEQERIQAEQERERAERLAERLRALGIDPEQG